MPALEEALGGREGRAGRSELVHRDGVGRGGRGAPGDTDSLELAQVE